MKLLNDVKTPAVIILAAIMSAVTTLVFLNAGGLYPGGIGSATLLIQRMASAFLGINIPYTAINLILNAIPVYIGLRFIGKRFTGYSILFIVLSSIFVDILPIHYTLTDDILLIAIFGGLVSGAYISICLIMETSTGGTDFISIFLSEKYGFDAFNILMGYNVVILIIAGVAFGMDKALYSIIYQYVQTQTLHLLYRNYQKDTLFVVTQKEQEILHLINSVTRHGATIIRGEGTFSHREKTLIYSVISSSDSKKVIKKIREVDPGAFVNAIRTQQLSGRFYLKPRR